MAERRITIFGATGTAGAAVARRFLEAGWAVKAATRDVSSSKACELASAGADLIAVNLDDRNTVRRAMANTDVVYLSGPSLANRWDIGQAVQGINVADAAAEVGIGHLIYQSALVSGARGVLGLGSKRAIEERVAELEVPFTINSPGLFMENLLTFFPVREQAGRLTIAAPLSLDRRQGWLAVADIGQAALAVAENPQHHLGNKYELVAVVVNLSEVAAILSEEFGREVVPLSVTLETLETYWPQGARMFRWLEGRAGIDSPSQLRSLVGEPTPLRDWVGQNRVALMTNI